MNEDVTASSEQGIANTQTESENSQSVGNESGTTDSSTKDTTAVEGIADSKQDTEEKGIADTSEQKGNAKDSGNSKNEDVSKIEEYTIEAKEGEGDLSLYNEMCHKHKLTKAQAEGIINDMREIAKKETESAQKSALENYANTIKTWHNTCVKDKEFGGNNWDTTLKNAGKIFKAFDKEDELRKLLVETGFQHHPVVVRVIARAGKAMGEDTFINGKGGKEDETSLAERLYPGFKY